MFYALRALIAIKCATVALAKSVVFSPDSQWIMWVLNGKLHLSHLSSGVTDQVVDLKGDVGHLLDVSSDTLVVSVLDEVRVYGFTGGNPPLQQLHAIRPNVSGTHIVDMALSSHKGSQFVVAYSGTWFDNNFRVY